MPRQRQFGPCSYHRPELGQPVGGAGGMVDDEREHELTHSPRRSRWWPWDDGYASACTARLVEGLAAAGCTTVALQVAADNAVAIACYRNLGFRFRGIALQTRCERLTS